MFVRFFKTAPLLFVFVPVFLFAQADRPLYRITFTKGGFLLGTVLEETSHSLTIRSHSGKVWELRRADVASMAPVELTGEVIEQSAFTDRTLRKAKSTLDAYGWMASSTAISLAGGAGILKLDQGAGSMPGAMLLAGGLAFGPAVGNLYAGDWKRGILGSVLRVGGLVLIARPDARRETNPLSAGQELRHKSVGMALVFGGTLYNMVTIPRSLQKYHSRLQSFSVAPNGVGVRAVLAF